MSLQFSNTTSLDGIIQLIESELGFDYGYISGNTTRLKEWTAKVNRAIDDYTDLAIKSSGTWQFDDSGHSKYPIIKTNLVSSQRDYTILTDEQGNLVLDIFKAAILPSATATVYEEIQPFDEMLVLDNDIVTENTPTGIPTRYGKLANGIFLDTPTNYNATNGLKLFINREGSYFTTSDTTKKPGVPGIHHEYFVFKPCYQYARSKQLENATGLEKLVLDYEGSERLRVTGKIQEYFSRREKDVRNILTGKKINYI